MGAQNGVGDKAVTRRKSFLAERYWGRPIPGWGDPEPSILIIGLAPAAHALHGDAPRAGLRIGNAKLLRARERSTRTGRPLPP